MRGGARRARHLLPRDGPPPRSAVRPRWPRLARAGRACGGRAAHGRRRGFRRRRSARHFIIWPGIEGYNYPFQTPYKESWAWLVDGHRPGRPSVPGPRGLALPRAQELRAGDEDPHAQHRDDAARDPQAPRAGPRQRQGQHGLAAPDHERREPRPSTRRCSLPKGCSATSTRTPAGARSTTTTWSARPRSWRRSSSPSSCAAPATGARRAARLRPLPVHRGRGRGGRAKRAAVALHRRGRGADRRRGAARGADAEGRRRAPTSSSTRRSARDRPRRARRRHDRRQGARDHARRRGRRAAEEESTPLHPQAGLGRAGPRGLVARRARRRSPRSRGRAARSGSRARCTGSSCLDEGGACSVPRSSGTTSARGRVRRDRGARRARAADRADRQPRADRLHGAEAALAAAARARGLRAHPRTCSPKDYVRLRLTGERAIDAADASGTLLFDVAHRRWSDEVLGRSRSRPRGSRPSRVDRTTPARATRQAAALGVGVVDAGTSRSSSGRRASSSPRCPRTRRTRGARPRLLPRRAGRGRRWA